MAKAKTKRSPKAKATTSQKRTARKAATKKKSTKKKSAKKSAKKTAARASQAHAKKRDLLFDLAAEPWVVRHLSAKKDDKKKSLAVKARLLVVLGKDRQKKALKGLKAKELGWLAEQIEGRSEGTVIHSCNTADGPVILCVLDPKTAQYAHHDGAFSKVEWARARDAMGPVLGSLRRYQLHTVEVHHQGLSEDGKRGVVCGLEMASYRYRRVRTGQEDSFQLNFDDFDPDLVKEAAHLGQSVNVARHLVNVPAGELDPSTYAAAVKKLFQNHSEVSVSVWDDKRLQKEKMLLHYEVGKAAAAGPCLVKVSYKPKKAAKKAGKKLAVIGKGVTFDSGGLDIKPSAGMRLMKKDMGGSASTVGLAFLLAGSGFSHQADFYVPLAENAVSGNSFHPGDVITGRGGKSVEIHNTDAEGRLLLADSLALAAEQKPDLIIDMATLTGSMRVALGQKVAGYFSNSDELAAGLAKSAHITGDPAWRMPLVPEYKAMLGSSVAEMSNCANSPFGGSITAALFLEQFVGKVPWIHLDIYCWTEKGTGAFGESGGTGQMVQALGHFLTQQKW